jgi:hypothetical protein
MSLMSMLQAAQGGQLFAKVAESLDLDAAETRKAMTSLCPVIAKQLKAKAAEDDELFQSLLDLIDDGAGALPLEEPDAVTGEEAVSDGNAILGDIYGSRNAAMVALREAADNLPERELVKLAPICATAVVAALAQSNMPMPLVGAQPAAQPAIQGAADQGLIGTIIGGVIHGVVQGVVRELKSSKRWRSATGYTKSRSKRRTTTAKRRKTTKTASSKRRTTSASIEDMFRDILGKIGK